MTQTATLYNVIDKLRDQPFSFSDIRDFGLEEIGQVPATEILENDYISLYSLDFETRTAVFVETGRDVDMSQAPFMFATQYDEAVRVLTIPFDVMLQLADRVTMPTEKMKKLVWVHSIGRCGSTLASQLFAQIPNLVNLSEPFVLPMFVVERNANVRSKEELMPLLRATVLLLCKAATEQGWVIKTHSYCMGIVDWLDELFPEAKTLFLYRNGETWMESCLSAYFGGGPMTAEQLHDAEAGYRGYKIPLIPPIAALDPEQHYEFAEIMSTEWLYYIDRYVQFCEMGIDMLAIPYTCWKTGAQETAEAMLTYADCLPDDLTAVYSALEKDSQAGTMLAKDPNKKRWVLSDAQKRKMAQILQANKVVHSPDFVVMNTLDIT